MPIPINNKRKMRLIIKIKQVKKQITGNIVNFHGKMLTKIIYKEGIPIIPPYLIIKNNHKSFDN